MAASVVQSTTSTDQEKFVAAKLLQRSFLRLVTNSICDKVSQPKGTGTTVHFIRYKRMNVPLVTLTESVAPTASTISVEEVTATMDQWGDLISVSDIAPLTTKHPLLSIATELLSDNANRVIDRETQIVMLAGTNTQLGDGVVTVRPNITSAMVITDTVLHKARINLKNAGAPPRDGPSNMSENAKGSPASGTLLGGNSYLFICGPEIMGDVLKMSSTTALWAQVHQYQDKMPIYAGEVGTYLGFRFVETNFIARFALLGGTTLAVLTTASFGTGTPTVTDNTADSGALLAGVVYPFRVTRKDLTRGFEEDISISHEITLAADANNAHTISFAFPSTAGKVYNLYFASVAGTGNGTDALLKLVQANIAASATVKVTALQATGTSPPSTNKVDGSVATVYPAYLVAQQALAWTGLMSLSTPMTSATPDKADPLGQLQTVGYKFMAKACILDQARLLRMELASAF